MANGAMVRHEEPRAMARRDESGFSESEIDLIKTQIAPGTSDGELRLFLHVCKSRGLDPFARQIWAISRKAKDPQTGQWVDKMTIQTAIDGFRLIAKRSGLDAIDEPEFAYDASEKSQLNPLGIVKATVRVWPKGSARPTVGTAYWDEYRQATRDGRLTGKWADMPRTMIAKCAEALALRRAFPEELAGIYTNDEMDQADNAPAAVRPPAPQVAPVVVQPDWHAMAAEAAALIHGAATLAELDEVQAKLGKLAPKGSPHRADVARLLTERRAELTAPTQDEEPQP